MSDTTATVNGHTLQMPTADTPPADDLLDLLDLLNCLARLTQPLRIVIARPPDGLTIVLSAAYPSGAVEPERPAPPNVLVVPAPQAKEDSAGCREDILAVLQDAGLRLTSPQILAELRGRGRPWSVSAVRGHLAELVKAYVVTNETSAKPRGYSLTER